MRIANASKSLFRARINLRFLEELFLSILANKFRLEGERSVPALYLWESEEFLLFQHLGKNVQVSKKLGKGTYDKNLEGKSPNASQMVYETPNPSPQTIKTSLEMGSGIWEGEILAVLYRGRLSMASD
jgi:hypothetical protein